MDEASNLTYFVDQTYSVLFLIFLSLTCGKKQKLLLFLYDGMSRHLSLSCRPHLACYV